MFRKLKLIPVAAALFGVAFMASTSNSTAESAKSFTKKDIESIVREYILNNPQIIEEAIIKRRRMQIEEQQRRQERAISQYSDQLFKAPHDFVAGNPKGDVTVVEFFDYNCGFCRRAFKDLAAVIEKDKNVRVVFKELPIFGKPSEQAARAALASIKQNKYFEFHRDLLIEPGTANEAKALKIAKKLGLDVKQLQKDMAGEDVTKAIAANGRLANQIGLEGTPLYVVGNQIINGAPEDLQDQILQRVKAIRAQRKKFVKDR